MTQIGAIGDPRASDPAHHAVAVTPSNTDDLPAATTALFVEGSECCLDPSPDPRIPTQSAHCSSQ